jgi:ABC-type antimicrobial peptide transport system permease subunit
VASVAEQLDPWLQDPKLYSQLFGAFAIIGLVLAAVGLFALTLFEGRMRQVEIGIRMSVGASDSDIMREMLVRSVRPVSVGILVGSACAWAGASVLQALVYGISARDLRVYLFVAALLLGTTIAAAWWPARQSSRLDVSTVLRAQ